MPVTVKMRKGIDDDHLTYLEAGRIAEGEGVAAVALHARTAGAGLLRHRRLGGDRAAQGGGDLHPGPRQRRHLVGRGRRCGWSRQTGCDGVVVGRGCLGRPWLFADLAAAFAGSAGAGAAHPRRGGRDDAAARRLTSPSSTASELKACRDIRKHIAWYLKGFPAGHHVRHQLALVDTLASLDDLLATLDLSQPWPGEPAEGQRGRAGSPRHVALPDGWLDSQELGEAARAVVAQAELSVSGG